MKKPFLIFAFFFIFILILVVSFNTLLPLFQPKNGQLSVSTKNPKARIYLDGIFLGTTPFYAKTLRVGEHKIEIEPVFDKKTGFRWETTTTLSSSTLSVLDFDLAANKVFSSGENLYFTPGQESLALITYPSGASVTVDGVNKGKSPLNLNISTGVHSLVIKKEGYLIREVTPNIEKGYKLSSVIYLAVDPFGQLKKLDNTDKLTLFSLRPTVTTFSTQEWVDGIIQVQSTFTGSQTKFDVLLDTSGKIYILNQTEWKNKIASKAVANIGYLAKPGSESLSAQASSAWQDIKNSFK